MTYEGKTEPAFDNLRKFSRFYNVCEGSTTHPGCWESTVWIILNKPIYITKQEVIYALT